MKQHHIQIKRNTRLENDYVKSHMLRTKIKDAESLLKLKCVSAQEDTVVLCAWKRQGWEVTQQVRAGLGGDSAG